MHNFPSDTCLWAEPQKATWNIVYRMGILWNCARIEQEMKFIKGRVKYAT